MSENIKQVRAAQKSPESQFKVGSEGSKIETDNHVCPPSKVPTGDVMCGNRGHETQEQHKGSIAGLKETEQPFASNPIIDNSPDKDSPELVRRMNSHSRDRRNGFSRTDDVIYPDND